MDGSIYRFDSKSRWGRVIAEVDESIHCVAISPNSRQFAISLGSGKIEIRQLDNTETLQALIGHVGPVQALVFMSSGTNITSTGNDRIVRLWDAHSGDRKLNLHDHARAVQRLALSPTSDVLLTGDAFGNINVWRALKEAAPHK